ncbi:MAG: putative membrane protein [Candidatus Nanohaloarchaea archaeon]|jgi:putative membrane protein
MKLSKLSIPYRAGQKLLAVVFFIVFFSPGSLATGSLALVLLVLLSILGAVSAVLIYEYLYWKNFEYTVEQDGLKIVSGVISKNDRDIPLKRIQNVDINRNILQRIVGIAKADVETAGGGQTEASLKYVDYEDAQRLQKDVRELKNRRKSDRTEDGQGEKRDDFVLSDRDLTVLSLASIDMRVIGGLALLVSFLGGSVWSQIDGALPQTAGAAVVVVLGVIMALGIWISTAVSKFAQYYDFRLQFHENAIEYERGLLNRSSGTIPEEKIQDIIIEENLIQRYFGYASLKVETAGYSVQQGAEVDDGSETVIPLAKRDELEKFAREIGGYTKPEFTNIDPKAKSRYFRRYLFAGTALGAVTLLASQLVDLAWPIYIPAVLIILSSRKASELKWENIGYYLDEKRVFTRKGFWNRKTYVIPYFRVQNFMETQTVFQRRWNQSTLLLDTAGSTRSFPQIIDMDTENARVLREQLFDSFKQSLQR